MLYFFKILELIFGNLISNKIKKPVSTLLLNCHLNHFIWFWFIVMSYAFWRICVKMTYCKKKGGGILSVSQYLFQSTAVRLALPSFPHLQSRDISLFEFLPKIICLCISINTSSLNDKNNVIKDALLLLLETPESNAVQGEGWNTF